MVAAVPVVRTTGPWIYKPSVRQQHLVVDQRATVTIQLDSATHTDTLSTHAEVSFAVAATTGSVNGTVTAFAVEGAGRAAATPAGLTIPFQFRAGYSSRELQLEFTTPRDDGACLSSGLAAVQSMRDLWFRPPDTLRVESMWGDSSTYVVCRDGIPIRAVVHRLFRVAGTTTRNGHVLLTVVRSSSLLLNGGGLQFGEAISVVGSGTSFLTYDVDPDNGEIVDATGESSLYFLFQSRQRKQRVNQLAEIRIRRS